MPLDLQYLKRLVTIALSLVALALLFADPQGGPPTIDYLSTPPIYKIEKAGWHSSLRLHHKEKFTYQILDETWMEEDGDEQVNEDEDFTIHLASSYLDLLPSDQFNILNLLLENMERNASNWILDAFVL